MAGLIDPRLNELLDFYWGDTVPLPTTPPATWYVGLFTVAPADAGTGGTEASWSGYARQPVTNNPTEWPAASAGSKHNANPIAWAAAGSGPTSLVAVGLFNHLTNTGATALWYWNLLTGQPIAVANGAVFSIAASALVINRC